MNQITILGATGRVGKNLLQKAIDKGVRVKALARNPEKLQGLAPHIEVIEGNYLDKDKLRQALEGSQAVLSTIGPPMDGNLTKSDENNYLNALAYIISQMQADKQTRWINISGAGIKLANENLPLARKLIRVMLKMASPSTVDIKDRELQLLEQSELEWTNIRPPMIKEEVKGVLIADDNKFLGTAVDLNQLTDFMLNELDHPKWLKKAPLVATK